MKAYELSRVFVIIIIIIIIIVEFISDTMVFTARRSYASAVKGDKILSVRLSICLSHSCLVTKSKIHCTYFDTARKGKHYSFLTPTVVGGRRPFRLKFALRVTHLPSKNADFDRFPLITSQP